MSNAIFQQFTTGMATLNNALRSAFMPDGVRCFLLVRSKDSGKKYEVVKELTSGWNIEFSEYRQQFKLLYSTSDATFSDEIYISSWIAYGVPDSDGEIEIFSIHPDKKDIIPPTGTNSQWKVYVDKVPGERFKVI